MNRSVQRGASYLTPDTTFTVLQAFYNKVKLEIKSQLYFLKCYDYFLRAGNKGHLNQEWIYEVIVSPKIPTKNYRDFCPTL